MRRAAGAIIMAFALVNLPTGAPQAAEQFQQAKLESFVNAALAVNRLVQQWTPKIQSAQNETEATQMREQANRELVAAIQQSDGITVDEYKQISQAAQSDPQLMQRITKIFDDMQGQSQPGQAQPGQTKTE
jgi:predicted GNAT superfamily acetyltransferase